MGGLRFRITDQGPGRNPAENSVRYLDKTLRPLGGKVTDCLPEKQRKGNGGGNPFDGIDGAAGQKCDPGNRDGTVSAEILLSRKRGSAAEGNIADQTQGRLVVVQDRGIGKFTEPERGVC